MLSVLELYRSSVNEFVLYWYTNLSAGGAGVDTRLSSRLLLSHVRSYTVIEFPTIEDVIFSVYVLGLTDAAFVLLSFLQEKRIKIPTNATEDRDKFFILNKRLILGIVVQNAGFAVMQHWN